MPVTTSNIQTLLLNNDYPESAFDIQKQFSGKDLILYGAGESSHWFVEVVMKQYGFTPSLVLDRCFSSSDNTFEDIPAYHPEQFVPSRTQLAESVVIICSGRREIVKEICQQLSFLGYKNLLPLHDIYEIHTPCFQPSELINDGASYFSNQQKEILEAFELLEDQESRDVFFTYLKTHIERRPVEIPRRPREEQYFPTDIKLQKGYSSFVSCGAYDGDTVRQLNQQYGKVSELVCFEADPLIFQRLATYLGSVKSTLAEHVTALPCAVYSHEEVINFTEATGLGSRISHDGTLKVQAVALDNILPAFSPTMITMDNEGVELQALQGAEKTIRSNVPDLGICVYHAPNQVWEVPLYLNSLGLGYKFYLRNYTSFALETVLYAST
ncbi:MAG: FkbM family methyltransferase [Flavobacteriales bacterium]|nr:FkbM family methyltransferase [Flavobacteriales bacterium]